MRHDSSITKRITPMPTYAKELENSVISSIVGAHTFDMEAVEAMAPQSKDLAALEPAKNAKLGKAKVKRIPVLSTNGMKRSDTSVLLVTTTNTAMMKLQAKVVVQNLVLVTTTTAVQARSI